MRSKITTGGKNCRSVSRERSLELLKKAKLAESKKVTVVVKTAHGIIYKQVKTEE